MTDDGKRITALIVIGLISGSGGNLVTQLVNPPRPDPFTGTQGRELERRIGKLENELPPKWLLKQVDQNTMRSHTCERLLLEIRAKHVAQ